MENLAFGWIASHSDLPSSFTSKWAGLVTGMQEGESMQAGTAAVEIPAEIKCESICIFWSAADINSFFLSAIVKHSLQKPICLSNLIEKDAMIHKRLLLGSLKRLWNSPECHAVAG